jgi:uncharacterized membrane protein
MACIIREDLKKKKWPSRWISYVIDPGFGPVAARIIEAAVRHVNTNTNVQLVTSPNLTEYLYFKKNNDGTFSSKVGYRKLPEQLIYKHNINLDETRLDIATVVHEICHSIGLHHEQTRGDRDDYVAIRFDHIVKGKEHNFKKSGGIDFGQYDYSSIMHYHKKQFAIRWKINIPIVDHLSKTSPALAVFNGLLHMVHIGNQSNDIWHSYYDGISWSADIKIDGHSSKASPALAVLNTMVGSTPVSLLHMVHIGDQSNDIWHSYYDGTSWSADIKIDGHSSKASPVLAVLTTLVGTTPVSLLHMIHIGNQSNDIWHSYYDGISWSADIKIDGHSSKASPALAVLNTMVGSTPVSLLHMVHIGNQSNDIWHSYYDGISWSADIKIDGHSSKASPALAVLNTMVGSTPVSLLHMVHIGDQSNDIWHSLYITGSTWEEDRKDSNQKSKAPVTLCEYNGMLYLVHLSDTTNNIWYSWYDPNIETISSQSPISIGTTTQLTPPDIAAINFLYPS